MSARRLPETDDTIYMVSQWKSEIDKSEPWWRRAYYRFIYLPFQEFSLKVVKVPKPTEVEIDGKKVTFRIWEPQGFFGSEHEADIACLAERWCYKDYRYGRLMPDGSGQYGNGPVFPRTTNPTKRVEPVLSMVIKDRKRDEADRQQLAQCLAELHQVLDR